MGVYVGAHLHEIGCSTLFRTACWLFLSLIMPATLSTSLARAPEPDRPPSQTHCSSNKRGRTVEEKDRQKPTPGCFHDDVTASGRPKRSLL